jgi:DNA-binding MarR family transcriptional regulator
MTADHDLSSMIQDWNREQPDLDMDSLRVFLPLRLALQNAERRRAAIFERHGITPRTLDLMVAVRRVGEPYMRTPSDLAHALVLTAGGVSQRLDRLERDSLIRRIVSEDDRRVVWVQLTKRGLRLLDDLMFEYMAHEERLLGGLDHRERSQLSSLLLKLDASISAAYVVE